MNFFRKKSSNTSSPYYKSIHDCSIYVWHKIRDKEDYSYLLKDNLHALKKDFVEDNSGEASEQFLTLLSEYFEEFGLSKGYKEEIDKKLQLIDLNLKFVNTGDRFVLNFINIANDELKEMQKNNKGIPYDIKKEVAILSKATGNIINTKTTSVYDYYTQRLILDNGN